MTKLLIVTVLLTVSLFTGAVTAALVRRTVAGAATLPWLLVSSLSGWSAFAIGLWVTYYIYPFFVTHFAAAPSSQAITLLFAGALAQVGVLGLMLKTSPRGHGVLPTGILVALAHHLFAWFGFQLVQIGVWGIAALG